MYILLKYIALSNSINSFKYKQVVMEPHMHNICNACAHKNVDK